MRPLHPSCSGESIGRWYWRHLGIGVPRNKVRSTLCPCVQPVPWCWAIRSSNCLVLTHLFLCMQHIRTNPVCAHEKTRRSTLCLKSVLPQHKARGRLCSEASFSREQTQPEACP